MLVCDLKRYFKETNVYEVYVIRAQRDRGAHLNQSRKRCPVVFSLQDYCARLSLISVLSIISCRMLEDELTSILVDDDIKQLVIVDSAEQQGLARKLRSQNRPFLIKDFEGASNLVKKHQQRTHYGAHSTKGHGVLQQLLHRRRVDNLAVVVNVLRLGIHIDSTLLKQEVYRQIERMADFSDGIFVLYGICDALRTLEQDFNGSACPLFFLAGDDGAKVEDCIALALGGNQAYANVLTNDKNIMLFLTPMVG